MSERETVDEEPPAAVQRVERELLANTLDLDREAERLNAMGQSTRFVILYLLAEEGQMPSGELADQLDRQQNDLYHHLNTLEEAGLVGKFRNGGSRVYELSPLAERFLPDIFEDIQDRASIA